MPNPRMLRKSMFCLHWHPRIASAFDPTAAKLSIQKSGLLQKYKKVNSHFSVIFVFIWKDETLKRLDGNLSG
jgi:hypothetical protein